MLEKIKRSFKLVKESFKILLLDKEMLLFPIISGTLIILLFIAFALPVTRANLIGENSQEILSNQPILYLWIFLFFIASSFIGIFFNVALISCVYIRLKGKNPTLNDGLKSAFKNIHKIASWTVIATTVGFVLDLLRGRSKSLVKAMFGILELGWSLATFFVIPVMIIENIGVFASIKKSAELFKRTWGESVVGRYGIGIFFMAAVVTSVFGLVGLGIFSVFLLDKAPPDIAILSALIIPLIFLIIAIIIIVGFALGTALSGVYNTVLYIYATSKKVPTNFNKDFVVQAYRKII